MEIVERLVCFRATDLHLVLCYSVINGMNTHESLQIPRSGEEREIWSAAPLEVYHQLEHVSSLNSCPVVYEANGYVRSLRIRQRDDMRPANYAKMIRKSALILRRVALCILTCFVRPVVDNRSPSRAYSPPMKLPIEQPPIASTGICISSKASSMPRCDIPLPPPPPSTNPILLPQSLLASRAKSLRCGGRRGLSDGRKRYFLILVSTFSRKCLKATTAAGSCTMGTPLMGTTTPGSSIW
jgi:hypothetical protein